jgi:biopolymer transport protein TolQ
MSNSATIIDTAKMAGSVSANDMTPLGLFLQADILVQSVMIGLLLASLWCWSIIFDKWWTIRKMRESADRFEDDFWNESSLDSLYDRISARPQGPMAKVFVAGMKEWRTSTASARGHLSPGLKERVERVMGITAGREMDELEKDMTFLASLGSAAPFIGLFGTVWGIMNSFTAIAGTKDTSLAVVAPGIAEALFATALGLVAAIPAVLAYNKFATELGRYGQRLTDFSDQFSTILSRRIDERIAQQQVAA